MRKCLKARRGKYGRPWQTIFELLCSPIQRLKLRHASAGVMVLHEPRVSETRSRKFRYVLSVIVCSSCGCIHQISFTANCICLDGV